MFCVAFGPCKTTNIRNTRQTKAPNPPRYAKVKMFLSTPRTDPVRPGKLAPNLNPLHSAEHFVGTLYLALRRTFSVEPARVPKNGLPTPGLTLGAVNLSELSLKITQISISGCKSCNHEYGLVKFLFFFSQFKGLQLFFQNRGGNQHLLKYSKDYFSVE